MQVKVTNILDEPTEQWPRGANFSWPDEAGDVEVDSMVKLIEE